MPTRVLGARRGVTKPAPWCLSRRGVAPEWRWVWDLKPALAIAAWSHAGDLRDLSSNRLHFTRRNATWSTQQAGPAIDLEGANRQLDRADDDALQATAVTTWACRFYLRSFGDSGDSWLHELFNDAVIGSQNSVLWRMGSQGSESLRKRIGVNFYDGANNDIENDTDLELNRWYNVVVTTDGSNIRWYIDGALDTEKAYSVTPAQKNNQWNIGYLFDDSEADDAIREFDGFLDTMLYYPDVAWTANQAKQWSRDPFGWIRAQQVAWVGGPTAAGQTISAAWSETVGTTDSEEVDATLRPGIDETAGPTDTQDAQATLRPEITETVGATDVFEAAATLVGAWDETAGPRETYEVAKTVTATLDETVGPTDTQGDVVASLAASISEGLDAGETWAATLMATAAYSETVGPQDTFELPATVVEAAWSEGTDASDTFLATLAAVANLQEIVGTSETIEVDASLVASYLETVGPTDLWEATGAFGAAISETAGPTDSFSLPADAATKLTALIQTAARVAGTLQSQPKVDADDGTRPGVDGTPETSA